ncbi:MAG TPA: cytochrome c biogenesis protein CcsA [Candidatus Limnocylindrales bacterium]|nr:cytochrome c biogenesis protein CcsA [Candidatus Limnocylindrales bacterium]
MTAVPNYPSSTPAPAATATSDRVPPLLKGLTVAALIAFVLGMAMALFFAGTDQVQGQVQRIFYIHLAAFFGATLAFSVGAVGGVAYLRTRKPKWDSLSLAGIEVGFALALITLITGMVWARPIWNTWWTWDPRLTSTAIMILTYAAYFMLRGSLDTGDRKRMLASVFAILAITTVILTIVITRIRPDTIHPVVIGPSPANAQGSFEMATNMGITVGINIVIWALLVTPVLIWWRVRLENRSQRIEALRAEVL